MRTWRRRIRNLLLLTFLCVMVFEILYRHQVVDTYKSEFQHLNRHPIPQKPKARILVMGDSFTALDSGWLDMLRSEFPQFAFFNGAVPGTGPIQASYMAPRRFRQAEPDAFIYQIYLGNDLFDIRNPISWSENSFFRNLYWATSNRLRSLGWLNYKLGQFRAKPSVDAKERGESFSPELYNARDRRYSRIAPAWLADQLGGGEDWEGDLESYVAYLEDLIEEAEERDIPVLLMVVPHCAEMGGKYWENMAALGMEGEEEVGKRNPAWVGMIEKTVEQRPKMEMHFLLPDLQEAEDSLGPVFHVNDPHVNAKGHVILASAAAKWLRRTFGLKAPSGTSTKQMVNPPDAAPAPTAN